MPEDQKSSFSEAVETGASATLAYARGDAKLVAHSLQALMNQGIAGLMVKTAYFSELPQAVLTVQLQAQCGQVGSISEKSLWQSLPCLCCRYYLFSCSLVLFSVD